MRPLGRDFYFRDAQIVARELLGKLLVYNDMVLRINETEAYLGIDDPACHSYKNRRTSRTEIMYGPGGYSYVYLIYGMYHLLNAITGEEGDPCAVLIRAGQPVAGFDAMSQNRFGTPWVELSKAKRHTLSDGPGKLSRALGLNIEQNGLDLTKGQLLICEGVGTEPFKVEAGPRIGVDYAGDAASWPLNFRLMDIA